MNAAIRHLVRKRAGDRCEYCRLPQTAIPHRLHVEHVIAQQHEPTNVDDITNLALACDRCNFHKGPNLSSLDPESGLLVRLFNPRTDSWDEHFMVDDAEIVGLTPTGRATARLLNMNADNRVLLRRSLL